MSTASRSAEENTSHKPFISSSLLISRLPPEILSLIFLEVLRASRASVAILTVSWVSRTWRNIALSTPELWAWIDTVDMEAIQTFMTRAKSRPLSITLHGVQYENRLPITTVLKSLHNIRHLDLSVEDYENWARMGEFVGMTRPAPALETLHLTGFILPEPLFSGSLPSLRDLRFESVDDEWTSIPDCPQLRLLCMTRPETLLRIPEFLERLPTFPMLEQLELDAVFHEASGVGVLTNPIELPNLKYLILAGEETRDVVPFLQHLRIPSTCSIKLEVGQIEPEEYLLLFPASSTCRSGTTSHIRELRIVADGWLGMGIVEWNPQPNGDDYTAHGSAGNLRSKLHFKIWPPWDHRMTHRPIQQAELICQSLLDLSGLEVLALVATSVNDYPTQSFWESIDSLPSLRVLKVRQIYAQSFIEYLSTALTSTNGSLAPLPFHVINKLVYEDPSNDVQQYPSRLTELIRYLRVRMDNGFQLETLTLVHIGESQIPDELLQDIKGLVRQLKRKVKTLMYAKAKLVSCDG
ncbi:hypothetical protein BDN72DRAFT_848661 [Pluteus cervinus]|uniref:Uncharacterized protein n=1 Tax=Pluteus cervinus TaxID=181527 RepID=A0ACD3AAM2_9AGAR|nr:hypothetical protein BDN72DRAFT_848661 [Pluteus cervinus]